MKGIDRVRRRQRWRERSDRVTAALVGVLVVVSGLTLLPSDVQQRIMAFACQGVSLGLTDCMVRLYNPPTAQIRAVPLCAVDQVVDDMVPTVERQTISFSSGGQLERWVARDGTVRVVALPERVEGQALWGDQAWPTTQLLQGVELPLGVQWSFTTPQDEQEFVTAVQRLHAQHYQQRSAISPLLRAEVGRAAERASAPTVWIGESPLEAVLVEDPDRSARQAVPGMVGVAGDTATLRHDTAAERIGTTVASSGVSTTGTPVYGALRWERSETGEIRELIGSWAWREGEQTVILHLSAPLADGDQDEIEAWLSTPEGPTLDLSFLRAQRSVESGSEIERLLYAAAIVGVEYRTEDPAQIADTMRTQMALDRRPFGELTGPRSGTELIRPQPSGAERVVVEVLC